MAVLSVLGGCIIFDTSPAYLRMLELTDEDGDGSTLAEGDCNDADPRISPESPEVCDGLDNDCDYATDEDGGGINRCIDQDGDGHGDVSTSQHACLIPAEGVATCDDCDDTSPTIYPSAEERCDEIDNNCDSVVDDDASVDAGTWYRDDDGDGYGEEDRTTRSCLMPDGYAEHPGDSDGEVELLIGASGSAAGFSATGQVLSIEPGQGGTRAVEPADIWAVGAQDGEFFGVGLQRADGFAGDGEYLLIGVDRNSDWATSAGKLYFVSLYAPDARAAAATIVGTEAFDYLGTRQPPLIDFDGDGFDDLAIGTYDRNDGEGLVTLFHGPLCGDYLLDDGDATISEPGTRMFGLTLTTVSDPEGAGTGRLIVSSAGEWDGDYDGAVHILSSTLEGAEVLSDVTQAVMNGEVDRGGSQLRLDRGDLNGDGTDDLLVGDPLLDRDETTGYSGAVYLLTDPLSLVGTRDLAEASTARFYGRSSGDHLGASLAIGDANHDGRNDLLFAGDNVDLESDPGGVYFLLGEGM